jgi:hypothetical protein
VATIGSILHLEEFREQHHHEKGTAFEPLLFHFISFVAASMDFSVFFLYLETRMAMVLVSY